MNRSILFGATALLAGSLIAADSSPKDDVAAAAKKLADTANYTWRTVMVLPEDSPWHPGPTDGKTEKDGATHVTMRFGENPMQFVIKGEKAAVINQEGEWRSLSELDGEEGPARWLAWMVRNFQTPAAQAADLVKDAKDLKQDGEKYTSDLTPAGAEALLTFRRRGAEDGGPTVSNAKASVTFWLKDGVLVKYETKVKGTLSFDNNNMDVERTTPSEIKDAGTTKLQIPEAAQKKLS